MNDLNKRLAYSKNKQPRELLSKSCHEVDLHNRFDMTIFGFINSEGDEITLHGFFRGPGAISGDEKYYTDQIGVYTSRGDYYNIEVDLRKRKLSKIPTYKIGNIEFYHPILKCFTMGCKVNPENGWLLPNEVDE